MIFVVRLSSLDRGGSALHQVRTYIHILVCCWIIKCSLYSYVHGHAGILLDYQVSSVHMYVCTYAHTYVRIRIFVGMQSDYQVFTVLMYIRMYVRTYVYSGTSLLRTLWDLDFSPYYRGVLIQRSLSTLQYYTGTQNGVLIIEVSAIQRFVIERSHCT